VLACSGQPWNRVPMPGMLATGTDMTAVPAPAQRRPMAPEGHRRYRDTPGAGKPPL